MKNIWVVGLLMFFTGIAVGWFARETSGVAAVATNAASAQPVLSKPAAVPATGAAASPSAAPGKRAIRDEKPKMAATPPEPDQDEVSDKIQSQMTKAMAARQRSKFEQHIQRLADSLKLTDAQKAGLSAWLDERISKIETMDLSDAASMTDGGVLKGLTTDALEDHLASTLTEDQKTALAEFEERDHQTKVDSMALKSLSQIQGVIDFEDGQRDEVYKILTADAGERLQKQSDNPDASSIFTDGMGVEIDPYDLGIQDAMSEAFKNMGDGDGTMDQKAMAARLREVMDRRIEAKIEKLRPVLNDKQLEQYRTELKNKGSGFLGNAMIGLGAEEDVPSSTIAIPAE